MTKSTAKPKAKAISKSPEGDGNKVQFDSIIWVLNNLTNDELAAHDAHPYDPSQILDLSNEMIEDGFQFSWKFDSYSQSRQCSAMCLFHGHDNTGLALSARGEDVQDCMSIILYKYYNIAKRDLRGFTDIVPKGVRG